MTLDEYFEGSTLSRLLFDALYKQMNEIASTELCITKSQVACVHKRAFAWIWIPAKYLRGKTAPLVLTLVFKHRDPSPRWKEIVEPSPGNFTHHLELNSVQEIDEQVRTWLEQAFLYTS